MKQAHWFVISESMMKETPEGPRRVPVGPRRPFQVMAHSRGEGALKALIQARVSDIRSPIFIQ